VLIQEMNRKARNFKAAAQASAENAGKRGGAV
jgi:hypothetical protein